MALESAEIAQRGPGRVTEPGAGGSRCGERACHPALGANLPQDSGPPLRTAHGAADGLTCVARAAAAFRRRYALRGPAMGSQGPSFAGGAPPQQGPSEEAARPRSATLGRGGAPAASTAKAGEVRQERPGSSVRLDETFHAQCVVDGFRHFLAFFLRRTARCASRRLSRLL